MKKYLRFYLCMMLFWIPVAVVALVASLWIPHPAFFAVLLAAWIAGLVFFVKKLRGVKNAENKPGKIPKIMFLYYVLAGILLFSLLFFNMFISLRLEKKLRPYVKKLYSSQAGMPDNPRFVFYDAKRKTFLAPKGKYKYGTNDPDKASVIVVFSSALVKSGTWVAKTGGKVGDGTVQKVSLTLVRKSDWSLIETKTIDELLNYGRKTKKSLDSISGVEEYLNAVFQR